MKMCTELFVFLFLFSRAMTTFELILPEIYSKTVNTDGSRTQTGFLATWSNKFVSYHTTISKPCIMHKSAHN
ncbi:hypothetical protein CLU79DRAFT_735026 [Phycomyces nitens]|nr:hypothetical protein CLU79DRAFT_735026 [Phycomyces nitens]